MSESLVDEGEHSSRLGEHETRKLAQCKSGELVGEGAERNQQRDEKEREK